MVEQAKRRRRKEERPREILEAAFTLFTERGFSATRIDDVAAAAGVGKGTLYLYFPGKEALFAALVREAVLPDIARIEAVLKSWTGSQASLLRKIIELLGAALSQKQIAAFPRLVIAEAGNFPQLAAQYRTEVIERGLDLFVRVIRAGIEAGEFRPLDVQHAARLCVAPLLLLALWRSCFERPGDPAMEGHGMVETHIETLLRGLAAERRP